MTYAISDIHGEYELLLKLLEKIEFSTGDKLYVLGDMIDKGDKSVHVLKLLFSMPNATCIVGNHEYAFLKYYWGLMRQAIGDYDAVLKRLQGYFTDGSLLDWDIMDKVEGLPCYVEENGYFGVHARIPIRADKTLVHPKEAMIEQLVYDRGFKEFGTRIAPTEKCVLYGHTPTRYLTNNDDILFHHKEGIKTPVKISDYARIHLDTGVSLSGVLGCLCIEDCKCYYVKN